MFRLMVSGVLLLCKYRLFPYVQALLTFMELCWGLQGSTWETWCCQQAALEAGKQKKKNKIMSFRVPTGAFPPAPPLHNAFQSFREGIYLSALNMSRSSWKGYSRTGVYQSRILFLLSLCASPLLKSQQETNQKPHLQPSHWLKWGQASDSEEDVGSCWYKALCSISVFKQGCSCGFL